MKIATILNSVIHMYNANTNTTMMYTNVLCNLNASSFEKIG